MNKPKHTPGPWKVELSGSPNKYVAEIWNQNTKVAEINHEHLNHDVDDMANARLIAAAPEMFEFIKSLIPTSHKDVITRTEQLEIQKRARKLIAKATGEANE